MSIISKGNSVVYVYVNNKPLEPIQVSNKDFQNFLNLDTNYGTAYNRIQFVMEKKGAESDQKLIHMLQNQAYGLFWQTIQSPSSFQEREGTKTLRKLPSELEALGVSEIQIGAQRS